MTAPILAVDPGTRKSGYAVLTPDGGTIAQGVEPTVSLLGVAQRACADHGIKLLVMGQGTNAKPVVALLEPLGLLVRFVDERETTIRARALYFRDHPPRGWRWLVPLGLQLPPRPVDDYAAVLIGRRFLGKV